MSAGGQRTSAECKLEFTHNSRPQSIAAKIIEVQSDAGIVLTPQPLPIGSEVVLRLKEHQQEQVSTNVAANLGNDGAGYRLLLRLRAGSWPYRIFVSLTMMAGDFVAASPSTSVPSCLIELELSWPCTADDVERAFFQKVRTAHPDRGGTIEGFVRLRAAYLEALALVGGKR